MKTPVLSALVGTNADLFAEVSRLYFTPEQVIIDMNYGKGVFYKKVPIEISQNIVTNDLFVPGCDHSEDCRSTEWEEEQFDVVILDPPYKLGTSAPMLDDHDGFGNNGRKEKGIAGVRKFYLESILESHRILKPAGLLMVKTMDQVESGKNHWLHIDVASQLEMVGFQVVDLFVLLRKSAPPMRHDFQVHSRKSHSYLWIGRRNK